MVLPGIDILAFIPKEIKLIIGITLFMFAGNVIIQTAIFLVNIVIGALNLTNGCADIIGTVLRPSACIPAFEGIILFGINFTDFWILSALIFFPAMMFFAFKWYAIAFQR